MQVGKIEYAPNYGKKDGVTVPLDTAARQAVEGVPCYMYGIRAPEDDDLPVAGQRATQEAYASVRDAAEKVAARIRDEALVYDKDADRHFINMSVSAPIIATAILEERKRCAEVARSFDRWEDGWDDLDPDSAISRNVAAESIAAAIESGQ